MAKEVFIYLIKSGIILSVLYTFYFLFFQKRTFHTLNRFLLLSILVLAAILPLITLPEQAVEITNINQFFYNDNLTFLQDPVTEESPILLNEATEADWPAILLGIYLTILIIFFIRSILDVVRILGFINHPDRTKLGSLTIVNLPELKQTFSFLKYIFINPNLPAYDKTRIINHEKTHISQLHTIDLIIVQFFVLLQWFNPFIYLLRRAIKEVHEFQADKAASGSDDDFIRYQQLLINQVELKRSLSFTSSFNSLTLKRLKMMTKNKTRKIELLSIVLLLPLIGLLSLSFSKVQQLHPPLSGNDSTISIDVTTIEIENLHGLQISETDDYTYKLSYFPGSSPLEITSFKGTDNKSIKFRSLEDVVLSSGDTTIHFTSNEMTRFTSSDSLSYFTDSGIIEARSGSVTYENTTYQADLIRMDLKLKTFHLTGNVTKLQRDQFEKNIPSFFPVEKVEKMRIASGYGKRIHPIYKIEKMHNGMDISAPLGTEVYASANGTVKKVVTERTGYGKFIIIDHDAVYSSLYAQLNSQAVKVGQTIKRGELIGTVGSSGSSTAPHLHFEIKKNGKHVDPADYFPPLEKE
jgi:murein DD-endopeptidase MepM/ murein hydrolase activator NlpD